MGYILNNICNNYTNDCYRSVYHWQLYKYNGEVAWGVMVMGAISQWAKVNKYIIIEIKN